MSRVDEFVLNITPLNKDRNVYVYLPVDYEKNTEKYDVVYMHDAQNVLYDEKSYGGVSWGIMRKFNNPGQKQAIFVCIDHGSDYRISEYSVIEHSDYLKDFIKENSMPTDIQGESYMEWLVDELIPFINKKYRTKTNKENTSIIGASMGGVISMYGICKYPEVFGNAGVLSPAFWSEGEKYYDFIENSKGLHKVYMSVGTEENGIGKSEMYVNDAIRVSNIIATKTDFMFRVVRGGKHNEIEWDKLMPEILNFFNN